MSPEVTDGIYLDYSSILVSLFGNHGGWQVVNTEDTQPQLQPADLKL